MNDRFLTRVLGASAAAAVALACVARLHGQVAPVGSSRPLVVRGATILTVTQGTIVGGTLVVRDGKIEAAGASVPIPPGAEVVDATGKFVTPGLVDEHTHLGLVMEAQTRESGNYNEAGTSVSAMTSVRDLFDPSDVNIYREMAGGVTAASALHGSTNPIGGQNLVFKLRWGKLRLEDVLLDAAPPLLKFALGDNVRRAPAGPMAALRRYPTTRMGTEFVIRDALTRARAYQASWADFERRRQAGEDVRPPRRDLQLEPLVEVLQGTRLAQVHAYRADEMLMMMRLAEEFGFRVATFEHALEGYKIAKELAAHGAGVGTFADWWGFKLEALDAVPHGAALLTKAGVVVAINSDGADIGRRLNTEAAKTMRWGGLTEAQALALITINPARLLRIDTRVGSIEAGKDADFVIWTAHPFGPDGVVDRTYIDGQLYYDRTADLARVARVEQEKAGLVAAEAAERDRATGRPAAAGAPEAAGPAPAAVTAAPATPAAPPRRTEHDLAALEPRMRKVARPGGVMAIVNATIVPVTRPAIERGTILIRDGRIAAVGVGVPVPSGARVIDAAGQEVYPGWINARTNLGLAIPGLRGYDDTAEMLDVNPQLRTVVAYYNDSEAIPVARANGVTTVAAFPNGGLIGGQVPVMNLDGQTWEESALRPLAGITFQFPVLGRARPGGGPLSGRGMPGDRPYEDLRRERDAKLETVLQMFEQARAYARAASTTRPIDWTLASLVPIVERRLPLFTTTGSAEDIADAVAFAERAQVRIVICAGPEAAMQAALLSEKKIPVILGSVLTLLTLEDQFHAASYQAAGVLAKAGVRFAFATAESGVDRHVAFQAAISAAWGLPREAAIRALTIDAAEILGVAHQIGSIEPGKAANLLIAAGDPLDMRTPVTHVIINGRDTDLGNRQESLYQRYLGRLAAQGDVAPGAAKEMSRDR